MTVMLMELTPFQHEYDRKHIKLSTTKLRENEKENKNSRFWNCYIIYLLLLEVKLSLLYCFLIDWHDVEIEETWLGKSELV